MMRRGRVVPGVALVLFWLGLGISASGVQAAVRLPGDLQAQVDQLLDDIERQPTTRQNLIARSRILWQWSNALSLEGVYVPKMLPLIIARAPAPRPGTEVPASYPELIDDWARQLSHLQADTDAYGQAVASPRGPFEVDSWQTVKTTLTVGTLGIAEGGGILVSQHFGAFMGPLQASDSSADHYLTVTTSRPAVRLERSQAPVSGPYGGFRGPVMFPKWIVRGAALEAGDTVTITYGDRSGGGRGIQLGTYSNDKLPLPLFVDPGDGVDYEIEASTIAVDGGATHSVHGFAPSIATVGERLQISVRSEDMYYNRATSSMPAYQVTLNGEAWGDIPADGQAIHQIDATFDRPGVYRFSFTSSDGSVQGVANPIWVQEDPSKRLYWGETHGHCGFSEGTGTPEGYYRFALEDARLDFATLSEHDIWLTDGEWQTLNRVSQEFRDDTGLITYPGYEWTTDRARGGHHNVLFRRVGLERVPTQEAPNLTELYRGLNQRHAPEDVLVIPHAHQAGDWRLGDLPMERLIEIMSGHGTFEWFGQKYLENGWRVGFIGASDDHLGHPGYAGGGQRRGTELRTNIFQFGGLAGVWAEQRDADSIFAAMRARSAYATSGSQRIVLDASLNGQWMGSEVAEPGPERLRVVSGRAIGTAPIESIDLIKNGEVVASMAGFEPGSVEAGLDRVRVVVSFFSDSAVFFRDNPRGHRLWNGSLTATGAKIESVEMLGTSLALHDKARLRDGAIEVSFATRGSARTVLVELSGVSAGARLDFAIAAGKEAGRAPTQVRPSADFAAAQFSLAVPTDALAVHHELPEGRYRDRVSVQRADQPRDDLEFRFEDSGDPGDWYYVRVIQIDGHRAWSSPWWVGDEPPR